MRQIRLVLEGKGFSHASYGEVRIQGKNLVSLPLRFVADSRLGIGCRKPDMQAFRRRIAGESLLESLDRVVIAAEYVVSLSEMKKSRALWFSFSLA